MCSFAIVMECQDSVLTPLPAVIHFIAKVTTEQLSYLKYYLSTLSLILQLQVFIDHQQMPSESLAITVPDLT